MAPIAIRAPGPQQSGFTLLEMIIAIAIFALISTAAYVTLNRFLKDRAVMEVHSDKMRGLQMMFALLERDVRYAIHRPVRSNYNEAHPDKKAMCLLEDSDCAEGDHLRLTRHQMEPQSYNVAGGSLQRVAWRLQGDELFRISWSALDRVQDAAERPRLVMQGVDNLQIKAYRPEGEESDDDGSAGASGGDDTRSNNQFGTRVLEILVTVKGSEYRRLLEVANGS